MAHIDALKEDSAAAGDGGPAPSWLTSLFGGMQQAALYLVGGWGPQGSALAQVQGLEGCNSLNCCREGTLVGSD